MKNLGFGLFSIVVLVGASTSFADGFNCQGLNTGTAFRIENKNNPSEGTRTADTMSVSNGLSSVENDKVLASFSEAKHTLSNSGTSYTADVDLRVTESSNADEKIAGTTLGELATIKVHVFFNYNLDAPSAPGQVFKGYVDYTKRNSEVLTEKLECTRHLKN